MDLYGCTDLRGRPAERGRGSHASGNQVIAGCRSAAGRARSSLSACAPDEGSLVPVFIKVAINWSINEEASPFSLCFC